MKLPNGTKLCVELGDGIWENVTVLTTCVTAFGPRSFYCKEDGPQAMEVTLKSAKRAHFPFSVPLFGPVVGDFIKIKTPHCSQWLVCKITNISCHFYVNAERNREYFNCYLWCESQFREDDIPGKRERCLKACLFALLGLKIVIHKDVLLHLVKDYIWPSRFSRIWAEKREK